MIRPLALAAGLAVAGAGSAQDFSEGSEAQSWGLFAERPARFEATVVDILCELSGDCPDDCGGGARQLGLLRSADGVLVYPNKNAQPIFSGAVRELQPFCGQEVEVDGLLIEDPDLGATNIYLVQRIRTADGDTWTEATRWRDVWAENHPAASGGQGQWFRNDPRIEAEIAEEGWFGLGPERDEEIIRELYE